MKNNDKSVHRDSTAVNESEGFSRNSSSVKLPPIFKQNAMNHSSGQFNPKGAIPVNGMKVK